MVCDRRKDFRDNWVQLCLNPYSIGIWSATELTADEIATLKSLNPYSIGIWSATLCVLSLLPILESLNPYSIGIWSATQGVRNIKFIKRQS